MKNKRANIPITILVFLVLSLFLTSIFVSFSSREKIYRSQNFANIQKVTSNKLLLEQNLYVVSKSALIRTFKEFSLGEGEYDYVKGRINTGEFSELHERLNGNFENRFRENFLEIIRPHNTFKGELHLWYTWLRLGKFQTFFKEDSIMLNFTYVSIEESDGLASTSAFENFLKELPFLGSSDKEDSYQRVIGLRYRTPMEISFGFEHVGLHGFEKIYSVKETCKVFESEGEMKDCFEKKLPNFIVDVRNVSSVLEEEFPFEQRPSFEGAKLVSLKSKTHFSFDNKPEPISIYFVPV